MKVLVAYASKYGATEGIAQHIAETIAAAGHDAEARPAKSVPDAAAYDAFVIGSAAYIGKWLKDAARFAERNREVLAQRPVWLFSSGPLGTDEVDEKGQDVRQAAEPKEFAALEDTIHPRGRKVFFGALDLDKLRGLHRLAKLMPASKKLLPEGDFRDWADISAWASRIADDLGQEPGRQAG